MPIVCCSGVNPYICIRITYCFTSKPKKIMKGHFTDEQVLNLVCKKIEEIANWSQNACHSAPGSDVHLYYYARLQLCNDLLDAIKFYQDYTFDSDF